MPVEGRTEQEQVLRGGPGQARTTNRRGRLLSGEAEPLVRPTVSQKEGKEYYGHNAFQNRTEHITLYEWFKIILMTVTLIAPLRLLGFLITMSLATLCSRISLIGIPWTKEGFDRPITPWRRNVNYFSQFFTRGMVFFWGYHWIRVKGKHISDPAIQAPICISNHNGLTETVYYFSFYWPCITAKADIMKWPFFGTILCATRPVWITQGEANQSEVKETILKRTRNRGAYRQLMMYPEGTTCNGESLLEFQLGAFTPGEPVQPIITRFPFKYFDPCFTDGGRPLWLVVYRMCCQFYNTMEVELLPIYYPNDDEKLNPILYAKNVREMMSKASGLPLSDQSIQDILLLRKAKKLKCVSNPYNATIGMGMLRNNYGCNYKQAAVYMDLFAQMLVPGKKYANITSLAAAMDLPADVNMERLFDYLNMGAGPTLDFWHYGRSMAAICHTKELHRLAERAFCGLLGDYDNDTFGEKLAAGRIISKAEFQKRIGESLRREVTMSGRVDELSQDNSIVCVDRLFYKIDVNCDGKIDLQEFVSFCEADRRFLKYFILCVVENSVSPTN